jgi:uncharacterized repeat protein (TIGR03803 family)
VDFPALSFLETLLMSSNRQPAAFIPFRRNSRKLAVAVVLALSILTPRSTIAQSYQVLHSFTGGSDGGTPVFVQLLGDSAGNLYGTTSAGGTYNSGTIFRLSANGSETVLYNFTGGSDGASPVSGLIADAAGNFYGTTLNGGHSCRGSSNGCGVVYKLDPAGAQSVLYSFLGVQNNSDGALPQDGLLLDFNGNLFGTTSRGGISTTDCPNGAGTAFELTPSGNSWTETQQYTFLCTATGGSHPYAPLITDFEGDFYGTTTGGGNCGGSGNAPCGIVFELIPGPDGWSQNMIYSFSGGTDGAEVMNSLVRDSDFNLYGATELGGAYGEGTLFRINENAKTVLHNFGGADGAYPVGGLIRDAAGNLYGTTSEGGSSHVGTVFELDPNGNLTTLHAFAGGADGAYPQGTLLLSQGVLYGTTTKGGSSNQGTVFQLSLPGTAPLQYDVSIYGQNGRDTQPSGQVTVNTVGLTTIQLNGASPSTAYAAQFCLSYTDCISVGTVTTNASGAANTTLSVPPGFWAGDFQLLLNGTMEFSTNFVPCCDYSFVHSHYYATLQPWTAVYGLPNGGPHVTQDPLVSGSMQVLNNGWIQVSLTGAWPYTVYTVTQCPLSGGSDCYQLTGQGTTDSEGDATFTVQPIGIPEDIFTVYSMSEGAGFVAGFAMPY